MPPNPPDDRAPDQARPTLRRRWKSLIDGVRGLLTWTTQNRLRAGLVAAACVVSVAGVVFGWLAVASRRSIGPPVTLDMVLDALDVGAYDDARRLANRLKEQGTLPMDQLGGPAFALGAAAACEGDDTWSKDKASYYLLAARYLEEARDRGFPPGRRGQGLFLLGKSLYLSGQIPASRPMLLAALEVNPQEKTEIHRLLAGAYLNDANPKLEKALAENTLYLSDRKLPGADRHQGLLERAQILLRLNRIPECLAALEGIPSGAKHRANAIIIRARVLMHEAQALKNEPEATAEDQVKARQKYQQAIKTLRQAQGRDTLSTQATRKALYLIGTCYVELGDFRAALGQFTRIGKLYPNLPEGLAASFQQAELSRQLGRDAESLAGYRRTLNAITDPENFSNPWITLDQLRSRMRTAYQHYLQTQNFGLALQLTRHFYPLFSRVRTLELTAEAHRAWGQALLEQAAHLPPAQAERIRYRGRAQLRHAGRVHLRLAELKVATRQYPDQLWNGATAYLQGQDYVQAVRVLQQYLKNESRQRHAQALVHLGEAWLAMDQSDQALKAFQECIEFHSRDAAAFRARLLASRAYLEKGNLQKVEDLLRENLNGEYLTPASKEWRDSLFALGELLHIQHRYEEAIPRLEEFVERYPDDRQTLQTQYLIADCCRQGAEAAQEKLRQDSPEFTGPPRSGRTGELFEKALDKYQQLLEPLSRRQDTTEMAPWEESMLRNCYFAIGSIRFQLGQYEASIKAYSTATNRYQNQPAALPAYVQIANAYGRLNRPAQACGTLEQAKVALSRMKPDLPFSETTNYSHQEWSEVLDSLIRSYQES